MTTPPTVDALARIGSPRRLPILAALIGAAGFSVVVAIGAVIAIRDTAVWGTTYAGAAPGAPIADLAAGLGLISTGLLVGLDRSTRRLGIVLMLAGSAWLCADLVGWQVAVAHVRVLAAAGAMLTMPLLLHAVAAAPGRQPLGLTLRSVVGVAYLATLFVGLALVMAWDPLAAVACWDLCSANPFLLVAAPQLTETVRGTASLLEALIGLSIAIVAAGRLWRSREAGRRRVWPMLLPGLGMGVALAWRWLMVASIGADGPSEVTSVVLFQLSAWIVASFAAGIALFTFRDRRIRAAIQALGLGDPNGRPSSATDVLAASTSDASLRISYPRTGGGAYVDAAGLPIELSADRGRALTTVTRDGQVVAVIDHDPDVLAPGELASLLGPAARLSLENERLDAELLAQVRDLRASRARIVSTADRERQRRERDLHDGAQQRLLALTYELRSARAAASRAGLAVAGDYLDAAIRTMHAAHDELRELAHGIYPAVLSEAGLARALEALVDRSSIPLRLDVVEMSRCEAGAEMTTYVVADDLVREAARRGATRVRLHLTRVAHRLVLELEDDGAAPTAPSTAAEDRAGAAGGTLTCLSRAPGDVRLRLEVPCASS